MSIRPIDYTNLISKSQEIARLKQQENVKNQMQLEGGFVQQNKRIKENMKTVRNSHRTEGLLVDTDKKEGREKRENSSGRKNKKQKASGKSKIRIGRKIDTKI
ncbi:MAG TPA: hypothetical protein GXX70_04060 [Tepidimicrobium sp.]|nr:hypothetical protein [Tepidimicrobium sp.]